MFLSLFKHLIIRQQRFSRLSSTNRDTGIVKRFSKDQGFGFIKRDSNGNDIFVHFQSILGSGFKTLEAGQQVEFKIIEGIKGPEARVSWNFILFILILFLLDVIVKNQLSDNQVKQSPTSTKERHIGVIRKFVKNRGFGFITRKSDGADYFVHSRSILHADFESLDEGMEVDFLEIQNNRGGEAKDVRILKNTRSI